MDDKERIDKQRAFERKRLDERGRTDLSRGRTDLSRGRTDLSRGRTDLSRGRTDLSRGSGAGGVTPEGVATDIFRGAASLGGHLVVAFIAPVSPSSGGSRSLPDGDLSAAEALAAAAQAEWADLLELIREKRKTKANEPPQPAAPDPDQAPVQAASDSSNILPPAGTRKD